MDIKKSEEILAEVHRNCLYAIESISDILPETDDTEIKEELMRQHEEYEHISAKCALLAKARGIELKNPGPIKKAMMWSGIKMNTMKDDSRSHIAEMMVQGTVMGVTALRSSLGEMSDSFGDGEVRALAEELMHREEDFEKRWKKLIA